MEGKFQRGLSNSPDGILVHCMVGGGFPVASHGIRASESASTVKAAGFPPAILGFEKWFLLTEPEVVALGMVVVSGSCGLPAQALTELCLSLPHGDGTCGGCSVLPLSVPRGDGLGWSCPCPRGGQGALGVAAGRAGAGAGPGEGCQGLISSSGAVTAAGALGTALAGRVGCAACLSWTAPSSSSRSGVSPAVAVAVMGRAGPGPGVALTAAGWAHGALGDSSGHGAVWGPVVGVWAGPAAGDVASWVFPCVAGVVWSAMVGL